MARTVLISGAGIAGTTLAWWLTRRGFAVTIVERVGANRSSGSPVDVQGAAFETATAMGIADRLRENATKVRELVFIDAAGKALARLGVGASSHGGHVELPRGDLARIIYEAGCNDAEYIFGDQIAALADTKAGVEVRFESGAERHFDLVIGSDGLHSLVRRLVFGPEASFVHHMGLYVATLPLPNEKADPYAVLLYNEPGYAISIHPARDRALCAFIFRHPEVVDFDYRDIAQHRRILTEAYNGVGWRCAELIEKAMAADELYFDSVSRVTLASWSRGRVGLAGDAASCLSLFGDGSSLAIAGARILAEELAETSDHGAAFARYERRQRRAVSPRQRNAWVGAAQIVPKTRVGIVVRNAAMRLVSLANRGGPQGGE